MSNRINAAEIFSAGTWNGLTFTEADLDKIVQSFTALERESRVPLKLGHDDQQPLTDGQPSLGWVERIWRDGQKLLATFTDVPTVVFDAIRKGLYKQISIELLPKYEQSGSSYPWVLDAVALLGADVPAVKTLRDLKTLMMASLLPGVRFGQRAAFTLDNHIGDRTIMTDAEIKALQDQLAAANQRATKLEEDNKAAEKARFTEKVASHRKAITDKLNTAVEEGRIYARTRDRITGSRYFKDDQEVLTACSADAIEAEIKQDQRADFKEAKPGVRATSQIGKDNEPDFSDKPVADLLTFRSEKECLRVGGKIDNYNDMLSATERVLKADKPLATAYFADQNKPFKTADAA